MGNANKAIKIGITGLALLLGAEAAKAESIADHTVPRGDFSQIIRYVQPSDSAVVNYFNNVKNNNASFDSMSIRDRAKTLFDSLDHIAARPNEYDALTATDTQNVHGIQTPSETLNRGAADCDGLTLLYVSLLRTAGINAGIVRMTGHVQPYFIDEKDEVHFIEPFPSLYGYEQAELVGGKKIDFRIRIYEL